MLKTDKKTIIIFSVIILFVLSVFFAYKNDSKVTNVKAASTDNVRGFAWSENIGWISFNSLNTGAAISYGVNLNADDTLSGYAWSENIGWISFELADIAGCSSGTCQPRLVGSDFWGWARALNHGDGWDGWISLNSKNCDINGNTYIDIACGGNDDVSTPITDYKVSLSMTSANDFEGWAWGGDVVGWVSFNCINIVGGCATSDYKVYLLNPNTAPTASITCDPASCEAYTYNGTNLGAYGIDLINSSTDPEDCPVAPCVIPPDNGFASCLWDIDTGSSTFAACSDINLSLSPGAHKADLTVTDQGGLSASAPQKNLTFKQDIFADFECSVDGGSVWVDCTTINPEAEDIVDFRASVLSVASESASLSSFSWDFGDGIGTDSIDPTSYTYAAGPSDNVYTVTLIITDSAGRQAKREYGLTVGASPPVWEEVRP